MVNAKKYVVKNQFKGVPRRDDFQVVYYELPSLQDGEILVKAEWISVDPYLRVYNPFTPAPYDQFGFQVGVVEQSNNPEYPVGTRVVSHAGWCDYSVLKPDISAPFPGRIYKLPDLQGLRDSLAVGAVGMPGATAYFGLIEECKPQQGETVVVSGAAGAVGSLVGQLAKVKGCRVIGFAGSEKKVRWLQQELGFDKAFNYKTVNVINALKEAAPNGVDIYFDNVGGEMSNMVMSQMNEFGRVLVCGAMSSCNDEQLPKATVLQPVTVAKQLTIKGMLIWQWGDRWPEAFEAIIGWVTSGQLKAPEHITEGFDKLYDAFINMLDGENFGKSVVKI